MLSTVVELYGTGGIISRVFFYFLDPLKKPGIIIVVHNKLGGG
jgi:hypothetical protein